MNVRTDIEIDGERQGGDLSDADFNRMLSEQVGKVGKTATTPTEQDQTDLSRQSTDEILSGLKAPESTGPSVQEGLTFEDARPSGPSQEELHERAEAARARARTELAKTQPYREAEEALYGDHAQRVASAFRDAVIVGDAEEAVRELLNLRRAFGDEYAMSVKDAVEDEAADDEWDDDEDFSLDPIWEASLEFDNSEAIQNAGVEAARYLREGVERQYASLEKAASEYFREKRVADEEANERMQDVYELANQLRGLDAQAISPGDKTLEKLQDMLAEHGRETLNIEAFPAEVFGEFVALADSWIQQAESEDRQSEFRERVLAAPSSTVAEGLETDTERLAKALERITGTSQSARRTTIDPERVERRAASRVTRAQDIKRAVSAPERQSVDQGLTDARGRKITAAQATGADRREAQRRKEAIARTMGR
jgi:hypothetical protein